MQRGLGCGGALSERGQLRGVGRSIHLPIDPRETGLDQGPGGLQTKQGIQGCDLEGGSGAQTAPGMVTIKF